MKAKLLTIIASAILLEATASATVTIQVSQIGVARATGFANESGVPTDGMRWGLVVSTTNSVFSPGSYDVFDVNTSGFLKIGGVDTDDYYVAHPSSTLTSTLTATGGDPGGAGGMTTINPVPFGGGTGISAGDPFQLIWFVTAPAAGSWYGMLGNQSTGPEFDIPNDTDVYSIASFFAGGVADPAKPATFQFAGAVIPEPSRVAFFALGLLGFLARRRR